MLGSILQTGADGAITLGSFLICAAVSLILGLIISLTYMYKNTYNKSFVVMLALLPIIVQTVITVVNGNLGVGVAVAGAFSLIRFRSAEGGGREIGTIFLAMAVGLADGMGFVGIAALLTFIVCLLTLMLMRSSFANNGKSERELRITIPENLDYNGVFDDLFSQYTTRCELQKVRTAEMGSVYELRYHVVLRDQDDLKAFMDQIRIRNGNLPVSCERVSTVKEEL